MNRPFFFNPAFWGSLLLSVVALIVTVNATSPYPLLIGLTLYNALWWLLQVPDYPVLHKDATPPDTQQEIVHLRRIMFGSRLISAFLLAAMSGIIILLFWTTPGGAGSQSLGIYGGILLITIVLGVFAEWRRCYGTQHHP